MKRIAGSTFLLLVLAMVSSCATRKVQKANEKIHLIEKGVIDRKAPGDKVYISFPGRAKDRPKSRTKIYRGTKGATVAVPFDSLGNATGFLVDCPEITEREKYYSELDYKLKLKATERAFNEMMIKQGKSFGLWAISIITVGWVVRGFFKK